MKKNIYIPNRNGSLVSPQGRKIYNSVSKRNFNFISPIDDSIIAFNNWQIDTCWRTNNTYYRIYGYVIKTNKHGEFLTRRLLESVNLNPIFISVIQDDHFYIDNMNDMDNGCWIAHDKKIIKMDHNLHILFSIEISERPSIIISSKDGGCYVFDEVELMLYKFDQNGLFQASINYANILLNENRIKDIGVDYHNNLWILTSDYVKHILFFENELGLIQNYHIDNISNVEGSMNCLNVGRYNPNFDIYIGGCYEDGSWISLLNNELELINFKTFENHSSFSLMNGSQWDGSNSIYLISEEDEKYIPEDCDGIPIISESSFERYGVYFSAFAIINENPEWFEITNIRDEPLDMTGWYVVSAVNPPECNVGDVPQRFDFPNGFILGSHQSVRVYSGHGASQEIHDDPPSKLFWIRRFKWNDNGDIADLYNHNDILIDHYAYGMCLPYEDSPNPLLPESSSSSSSYDESSSYDDIEP